MGSSDGDTYQLSDNLEVLKKKFDREKESEFCSRVILAKVKQDIEFGFGSRGDFFAEEVIEEWNSIQDYKEEEWDSEDKANNNDLIRSNLKYAHHYLLARKKVFHCNKIK
jgi:hypothetical protein